VSHFAGCQHELSKLNKQAEELDINWNNEVSKLDKSLEEQSRASRDITTFQEETSMIQRSIKEIYDSASERGMTLETDENEITQKLKEFEKTLTANEIQLEQCRQTVQKANDSLTLLETERKDLEMAISKSTEESRKLKQSIDEFHAIMSKLNLPVDIDQVILETRREDVKQQALRIRNLYDDIANLEIAYDNLELSASTALKQKEISENENIINQKKTEQYTAKTWKQYFDTVIEELEHIRNTALKGYIKSYGPLTTSIQKRLRSVVGFGDITLSVQKGGIKVGVQHEKEQEVSPSDYFSESQIQIVMLSLFLSANLTQNWSRFLPILLDDPVEHFDDLNSYALVGLIKRIVSTQAIPRQFIISTCDERLFKLMRQRFNTINGRVKYYRFSSIGDQGPVVEPVL